MIKGYSTEKLVDAIVIGMQEKKADNIVVLNLKSTDNSVCDYFVICDAQSTTKVDAIADSIELVAKNKMNEKALHKEGSESSTWILLDYEDVVVHIFQSEARDFYDIEEFWEDAEKTEIVELHQNQL